MDDFEDGLGNFQDCVERTTALWLQSVGSDREVIGKFVQQVMKTRKFGEELKRMKRLNQALILRVAALELKIVSVQQTE